jgi:uroporphyrinogen decarboxylase
MSMTSRERVKAAIAHEPVDRPPHFITFCPDAREVLMPHIEGDDFDAFVDNDVKPVGGIWWVWDQQEPDWFKMDLPTSPLKAKGFGSFETFYDNVARLADESDKYLLATIYGSHFEKAYFARGIENFLADMASEPEFARKLLQRVVDYNMTMLDLLLSAPGIDGVLLGSDWGTQLDLLMSPDVWDEMIRPGEQAEYDLIHSYGKDAWVHSCGQISRLVPRLVEMGLDVLNPIQPECMSLEWLHEEFGDDLAYYGGITTQTVLPFGNPDEVRAEARRVRDLLGNGGTGGGYIFAPSQDLQDDVPAENMLALLEVAKEIP